MKRSEIYLKAAEQMAGGYGSGICGMFCDLHSKGHVSETCGLTGRKFAELFKPDMARHYWWDAPPAGRNERVIALCLMAAIAADEERR